MTLLKGLSALDVQMVAVGDCLHARRVLDSDLPIAVVVTDVTLSDGNWSNILRYVVEGGKSPSLILVTSQADERLWSEALWRGVYDLLVEPYTAQEAQQVIEGAQRAKSPFERKPIRRTASASEPKSDRAGDDEPAQSLAALSAFGR